MVKRVTIVALLVVTFSPTIALAHGVRVFANVEGDEIHGQAEFHGDVPVGGAAVKATGPDGKTLAETKTDAKGKFVLKITKKCDHTIRVETPDGHGGKCVVAVDKLSARGHSHHGHGHVHQEKEGDDLHGEIVALRKQLADHDSAIRIRDVIGGIGYILGIAGIAFYLLGSRRKEQK